MQQESPHLFKGQLRQSASFNVPNAQSNSGLKPAENLRQQRGSKYTILQLNSPFAALAETHYANTGT